jgi:hypothetical protein
MSTRRGSTNRSNNGSISSSTTTRTRTFASRTQGPLMPRTLTTLRLAVLPCSAALLVAVAPRDAAAQERVVTSIDTTVALGRGGVVDLSVVSGDIRVVGWTRGEVHVRASTEGGELRFEGGGSRITLEQILRGRHGRHDDDGEAHYEVSVPEGTRVLMRSTSGDLSARGVKGDVEARSVSGGVEVDGAGDHTVLESVSGDVRATRLAGDVRANSVSGEVELSDVAGDAEGESVSGDVRIRNARSKVARAETVSGEVAYEGTIDPAGRYDFTSHSGDVTLVLPAAVNASVSIGTFSGGIESDFPLTLHPDTESSKRNRARRLEFTIGSGGPRINAETFSGDVVIRRVGGKLKGGTSIRDQGRDRDHDHDADDDDDDDDPPRI